MGIKFNPFTGNFDFVGTGSTGSSVDNFSYKNIETGVTVEVPETQEMLLQSDIMVDGDLFSSGNVVQLQDWSKWAFFWDYIPVSESIRVPVNRLMLYMNPFMVDGNLMVEGTLREVS